MGMSHLEKFIGDVGRMIKSSSVIWGNVINADCYKRFSVEFYVLIWQLKFSFIIVLDQHSSPKDRYVMFYSQN